ncbi:Hypothetical protein, putative, partial [Bodo saltans]
MEQKRSDHSETDMLACGLHTAASVAAWNSETVGCHRRTRVLIAGRSDVAVTFVCNSLLQCETFTVADPMGQLAGRLIDDTKILVGKLVVKVTSLAEDAARCRVVTESVCDVGVDFPTALWFVVDCSSTADSMYLDISLINEVLKYLPFTSKNIAVLCYRVRSELISEKRIAFLHKQMHLIQSFTPLRDPFIIDAVGDNVSGDMEDEYFFSRTPMMLLHGRLRAVADSCELTSTSGRLAAAPTNLFFIDETSLKQVECNIKEQAQQLQLQGHSMRRAALPLRRTLAALRVKMEVFYSTARSRDPLVAGAETVRFAAIAMGSIRGSTTLCPLVNLFRSGVVGEELRGQCGMSMGSFSDVMKHYFWTSLTSPLCATVCFEVVGLLHGATGPRFRVPPAIRTIKSTQPEELVGQDLFGVENRLFYSSYQEGAMRADTVTVRLLNGLQGPGITHESVREFSKRLFSFLFKVADSYRLQFVARRDLVRGEVKEFPRTTLAYVIPQPTHPFTVHRASNRALLSTTKDLHQRDNLTLQGCATLVAKLIEACYATQPANERLSEQSIVVFDDAALHNMFDIKEMISMRGAIVAPTRKGDALFIACRGEHVHVGDDPLGDKFNFQKFQSKVIDQLRASPQKVVIGGHCGGCTAASTLCLASAMKAHTKQIHLFGDCNANRFLKLLQENEDAHFHSVAENMIVTPAFTDATRIHVYQTNPMPVRQHTSLGWQLIRAFVDEGDRDDDDRGSSELAPYNFASMTIQDSELRATLTSDAAVLAQPPFFFERGKDKDRTLTKEGRPTVDYRIPLTVFQDCDVLPIIGQQLSSSSIVVDPGEFVFHQLMWGRLLKFWDDLPIVGEVPTKPCVLYLRGDRLAKRMYLRSLLQQLQLAIPSREATLFPIGVWAYVPPTHHKLNLVILECSELVHLDVFCMQIASVVRTIVHDNVVPEDTYPLLHCMSLAASCRLCLPAQGGDTVVCFEAIANQACEHVENVNTDCHGMVVQAAVSGITPSLVSMAKPQAYSVSEMSAIEKTVPVFSVDSLFAQRHLAFHYMPLPLYCRFVRGALSAVTSFVEARVHNGLALIGNAVMEKMDTHLHNLITLFDTYAVGNEQVRSSLELWRKETLDPLCMNVDSTLRAYCRGFMKLAELAFTKVVGNECFFCEVLFGLCEQITRSDDTDKSTSWNCQWVEEFRSNELLVSAWLTALEQNNRFAWNFATAVIQCREEYAFWLFSELKMVKERERWRPAPEVLAGSGAPFIGILLAAIQHFAEVPPFNMEKSLKCRTEVMPGETVSRCCVAALQRYEGLARLTSFSVSRCSVAQLEGLRPSAILRGLAPPKLTIQNGRTIGGASGAMERRTAHGSKPREGELIDVVQQLSRQCYTQADNIFVRGCFRALCILLKCSFDGLLNAPSLLESKSTIEQELVEACIRRVRAQSHWLLKDYDAQDPHFNSAASILLHYLSPSAKREAGKRILSDVLELFRGGAQKVQDFNAGSLDERAELVRGLASFLTLYRSIGLDEGVEQIFQAGAPDAVLLELPVHASALIGCSLGVIKDVRDPSEKSGVCESLEHLLLFLVNIQGKVPPETFRRMNWGALEPVLVELTFRYEHPAIATCAFAV